jgi:hypothetical protein
MTTVDELAQDLVASEPALGSVLSEHRAEFDGELLGHLFMAEVTRWLVANGPVASVLAVLERHLADGDETVQNVIALSFLENLEREDAAVRTALGPGLRAELAAMERSESGNP